MKTLLLNVDKNEVKTLDIAPTLREYYKALDCNLIDIVVWKIGNRYYSIMCDDEGLFKEDPKISAINNSFEPMLCGNLMFFKANADKDGNLIELDNEDIDYIRSNIHTVCTRMHPKGYRMLCNCEFY